MECNKEEAIRAKEMAQKKMEIKDFVNAKKVAQKAQKLYPDLKDISQMILVCDVHCAAENKVYGNENDWYGILQVEPTADEAAIKKQYRKLALLLHPDKNKLAGATDAFKIVGEAQKVLLDSEKRMIYDRKWKATGRYPVSNWTKQQGSRQPNPRGVHSWFQNPFPNNATQFMNQQHQQYNQETQLGSNNQRATFWTVCPFCSVRYQYYKELVNKTLFCQNCKKSFSGYEMNAPSGTTGINLSQPTHSERRGGASDEHATAVPQSTSKKSFLRRENQENVNIESLREKKFTAEKILKKRSKRRNRVVESSESSDSEISTDNGKDGNTGEEGENMFGQNFGCPSEQNIRRSARSKQQVSYDERLSSDDDLMKPSKRSRSSESFCGVEDEGHMFHKQAGLAPDVVANGKEVKRGENSAEVNLQNGQKEAEKFYEVSVSKDDKNNITPITYDCPDPEFSNFDKERREECFAAGQIWAVYDTLDAMPRFYALIKKVHLPDFKLQITWLEPHPDDDDEIKWVNAGLPVSCGKFRQGGTENCKDLAMFSHLACWEKGSRRKNYKIYPKQGETWAIFKDWDINWHSNLQCKIEFEYEFVEVLSNYVDNIGLQVAYLSKLKDFSFLFCRTRKEGKDSVLIPVKQMFRFSHKVPSFRMTGKEAKNVPVGSFELDPACLPSSHAGGDVSENQDTSVGQNHLNGSCSKLPEDIHERKNESKEVLSRTKFAERKEKSEEKDSFVDKVNVKDAASQIRSQNLESKGNATVGNFMEPIIVSDESETSTEEVGLKANYERNSSLGQAGIGNRPISSGNGNDCSSDDIAGSSISASETYTVPDTIFHDFDAEKSLQKFEVGQIWAIYTAVDALPKYYGKVQKIDSSRGFQLDFTWLVSCPPVKDIIPWKDKNIPVGCGKFKLGTGKRKRCDSTGLFSHQVRVESIDKNTYSIFPQKGDVWALYKDWSAELEFSELENCEYHIVEVLMKNELGITVLVLEQVDGFKSVFKPQMEGHSIGTMEIPEAELLRFSHQIPAFHLTNEKDGSLRGFLELDPAAMPSYYFCSS